MTNTVSGQPRLYELNNVAPAQTGEVAFAADVETGEALFISPPQVAAHGIGLDDVGYRFFAFAAPATGINRSARMTALVRWEDDDKPGSDKELAAAKAELVKVRRQLMAATDARGEAEAEIEKLQATVDGLQAQLTAALEDRRRIVQLVIEAVHAGSDDPLTMSS